MDYTTQDKIEAYLQRSLTDAEVESVYNLIPAISRHIEALTSKVFTVSEQSETRFFDGGYAEIFIDPADSIESVEVLYENGDSNQVYEENTDYILLPRGGKPITSLKKITGSFPNGIDIVKVTGKFGQAVPEAITQSATILVAQYITSSAAGGIRKRSIEGYSEELEASTMVQDNAMVMNLLSPYLSLPI